MCLTLVATAGRKLEAHLNYLARKASAKRWRSEQGFGQTVQQHVPRYAKVRQAYRGALASTCAGADMPNSMRAACNSANVMLNAGLPACARRRMRSRHSTVPCAGFPAFLNDPASGSSQCTPSSCRARHAANLAPVWGRNHGHRASGITFFQCAVAAPVAFRRANRGRDRRLNCPLFLFTARPLSRQIGQALPQHPQPLVANLPAPAVHRSRAGNQAFGLFFG